MNDTQKKGSVQFKQVVGEQTIGMNDTRKNEPIQAMIDRIIERRKERCGEVQKQLHFWEDVVNELDQALIHIGKTEKLNPQISGVSAPLKELQMQAEEQRQKVQNLFDRYNRDKICIGVGGAARMGKSTFLQTVTGLGDDQIPTSDLSFTTAGRSLIENSEENYAVADMHSKQTFLTEVLWPMFEDANLEQQKPESLDAFRRMKLEADGSQEKRDVIRRLVDTQNAWGVILPELSGAKGRKIEFENLRDYVAYPAGGSCKAGKFMAVANMKIYAQFPEVDIKQLKVVDLPGLGEAGLNLARVQTEGLSEVCDVTLLIKRPGDKNSDWEHYDSTALDVMAATVPFLDDLSLYTMILMNRTSDRIRSDACHSRILEQMQKTGRNLDILDCDVRDANQVRKEILPRILRLLARNLPKVDEIMWRNAGIASDKLIRDIREGLNAAESKLQEAIPDANTITFRKNLKAALNNSLITEYAFGLAQKANNPDPEWSEKIEKVTQKVSDWIDDGCGYEKLDGFSAALKTACFEAKGIPPEFINQLRISFRRQWDSMDDLLQERVVAVLNEFLDRIGEQTCRFVPPADQQLKPLPRIQQQLRATADKLRAAATSAEEQFLMKQLAEPLDRLSTFELRFRFQLEPQMQAASEVLSSGNLPKISYAVKEDEVGALRDAILSQLQKSTREYSAALNPSNASEKKKEEIKKRIELAVKDKERCREIITKLEESWQASLSFSPNRIFAALIDNETDAFCLFDGVDDAIGVWIRKYMAEMQEAPGPAVQAAQQAVRTIDGLRKKLDR